MASCLTLQSSVLTLHSKTRTGKESSSALQYTPQKTHVPVAGKENIEESSKSKYVLHPNPAKLFGGKEIVLELSAKLSAKDKRELKNKVTENGGKISFVVSKRTELMVCESENLATRKFNLALQYSVPIVTVNYLHESLKLGKLLPFDKYLVTNKITSSAFDSGKVKLLEPKAVAKKRNRIAAVVKPYVPCSSLENYQLLKAVQLTNLTSLKPQHHGKKDAVTIRFYIIELHCQTSRTGIQDDSKNYCVFTHEGVLCNGNFEKDNATMLCRFLGTVDDAVAAYAQLADQMTGLPHLMKHNDTLIHPDVGSPAFQSMQLRRFEMLSSLEPAVSQLVGNLWLEAVGHISEFLAAKPSGIRPWTVVEAEGILLQVLSVLGKCSDELLHKLSKEFYTIMPHFPQHEVPLLEKRIVVQKLDLCQVLKDMIAVSEATGWAPRGDLDAKYRALHCHIQLLLEGSMGFEKVSSLVIGSQTQPIGVNVKRVFEVQRSIEHAVFTHEILNQQMLFHCTMPSNLVGILSHGLLPPRLAVTKRGVERTDVGMLGSGIYFTNSISHAIKYSKPSKSGTRFLLVSMVALGDVYQVYKINPDLEAPPQNYNSVQGVKGTKENPSDFSGNEFVIYSSSQQKLCYLVEFTLPKDDNLQSMEVDTGIADCEVVKKSSLPSITYSYDLSDFFQDKPQESSSGLKVVLRDGFESWENDLALEAVHVRAKILDTVARVVLFQVYKNPLPFDVEVKFIFPLEFGAAVCGFEAFIGGKHIQGEVKEKETAHKEYKQAISEGHGAYLLDEDRPDVFTVHVGNLPSNTTAVIKISYITELSVERDAVRFTLPSSVAPWQNVAGMQSSANIANTVGEFTIQASLEMASDIISIHSPSHKIKTKKTDTKAVIELESGIEWGGVFILYARLKDAHVPRMWVEKHSKKDSEACMLTFYPEFEVKLNNDTEIVLMLDASNSMMGNAFQDAIRVCLLLLNVLSSESDKQFRFNLVAFGSFFKELFPRSKPFTRNAMAQAEVFLKQISPNMGNTDLHGLLRTYNLLTSSQVNVFVVSDGHIGEEGLVSSLSAQNFHIRVFTFATSQTANKHLLRTISNRTGGAFETFDPSETAVWKHKVKRQVERAQHPALSNISVNWQQFKDVNEIAQAPRKITSLFSGDCLVVYGFVSNCTMATLKACLQQQEFSTIVSTSELSKTKGNLIHSLVARGIVRDWEDGPLDDDLAVHWLRKRNSRSLVVELAKEHSLVTSLTSFLAVEKRHDGEIIADVHHILELLVQENVDVLPYMEFGDFQTQEEKTMEWVDESEIQQEDEVMGMGLFESSTMEQPSLGGGTGRQYRHRKGGGRYRHRKVYSSDDDEELLDMEDEATGEDETLRPSTGIQEQKNQKQSLPHSKVTSLPSGEYACSSALHRYRKATRTTDSTARPSVETLRFQSKKFPPFLSEIWDVVPSSQGPLKEAPQVTRDACTGMQMKPTLGILSKERVVTPLPHVKSFGAPSHVQHAPGVTPSGAPTFFGTPSQVQQAAVPSRVLHADVTPFGAPTLFGMHSQVQQAATLFGPSPINQAIPSFEQSQVQHGPVAPFQVTRAFSKDTLSPMRAEPFSFILDESEKASFTQSITRSILKHGDTVLLQGQGAELEDTSYRSLSPMRDEPSSFIMDEREEVPQVGRRCGRPRKSRVGSPQPKQSMSQPESRIRSLVQLDSMGDYSSLSSISEDIFQRQEKRKHVKSKQSLEIQPELSIDSQTGSAFLQQAGRPCCFAIRASAPPPPAPSSDYREPEVLACGIRKKKKADERVFEEILHSYSLTDDSVDPLKRVSVGQVDMLHTSTPKRSPSIVFVENIISWKGGGLPICSALFSEVKRILQQRGTSLSEFSKSDSPTEMEEMMSLACLALQHRGYLVPEEEMFDREQVIIELLEKHGLHSLGVTISEQVVSFVLRLALLYAFLLEVVFPEALQSEDASDFNAVIRKASSILAETDTWIKILMEVNEVNAKYPLIYSNLELGKSWEDFLMRKVLSLYFKA